MAPGHRIQKWRKFLSSSANKANFIRFLVVEWKTPKLRNKLNDKKLYVASEESCLCITKNQWADTTSTTTEDINKKGKFLYSAVSSPQDRSKRFTLYFPDRPVHSDTISASLGSIQPAINFSVQGVGSLSLARCHHARTAFSCMPCVPTMRLASGEAVFSNIHKSQPSRAWLGQK